MENDNLFMSAEDIAEITGISEQYAYKLIKQLNCELAKKGYFTIRGRISKQHFEERFCGITA